MRWTAPPDRREIAFILLCLGAYLISYNIEITLQTLGIDAAATKGAVLSRLGVGSSVIGEGGLKPVGWRDKLEKEIFGNWEWLPGQVVESEAEISQRKGSGRHGAQWVAHTDIEDIAGLQNPFGDSTVDNVLQHWGDHIPQTQVINHASGYTTLDNVYIFKKNVYLITDNESVFPPMSTILASTGAGLKECKIITVEQGRTIVGKYGSTIRGISWLHADSTPDNSTLFALWRTHSSMGDDETPLPRRLIFPHNSFFTNSDSESEVHVRSDTGFHPYTAKAAFPSLTVMYREDWQDYHAMEVPFVFERLVIADRSVALKDVKEGQPAYISTMQLEASDHWWEPVRKNLAQYVGENDGRKPIKAFTYLHRQGADGAKLTDRDHNALVKALQNFGSKHGYDVHVVSTETVETDWMSRMSAVVKSSIVIGVHGNHLMDSLFMRPSLHSTLIELFPANMFVRDRELAVQSVGLHYYAIRENRVFSTDLPPVAVPKSDDTVSVDVDTVIRTVRSALSLP